MVIVVAYNAHISVQNMAGSPVVAFLDSSEDKKKDSELMYGLWLRYTIRKLPGYNYYERCPAPLI